MSQSQFQSKKYDQAWLLFYASTDIDPDFLQAIINTVDQKSLDKALVKAVTHGRANMVIYLLSHGATASFVDSPLVQNLVKRGDQKTLDNALLKAVESGRADMVRYFLSHGARPFQHITRYGTHAIQEPMRFLKLAHELGIDLNSPHVDSNNRTSPPLLIHLATHKMWPLLKALLDTGLVNPAIPNQRGQSLTDIVVREAPESQAREILQSIRPLLSIPLKFTGKTATARRAQALARPRQRRSAHTPSQRRPPQMNSDIDPYRRYPALPNPQRQGQDMKRPFLRRSQRNSDPYGPQGGQDMTKYFV